VTTSGDGKGPESSRSPLLAHRGGTVSETPKKKKPGGEATTNGGDNGPWRFLGPKEKRGAKRNTGEVMRISPQAPTRHGKGKAFSLNTGGEDPQSLCGLGPEKLA